MHNLGMKDFSDLALLIMKKAIFFAVGISVFRQLEITGRNL